MFLSSFFFSSSLSFPVSLHAFSSSVFFQLDIANGTVHQNTIPSKIRHRYQSLPSLSSSSSSSSPYISPEKSSTPPPLGLSDSSRAAEAAACANSLASIFRVYGVTEQGESICAHVHSFYPYFYCRVPSSIERRLIQEDSQHYGEGTNAVTAQLQAFLDVRRLRQQEKIENTGIGIYLSISWLPQRKNSLLHCFFSSV